MGRWVRYAPRMRTLFVADTLTEAELMRQRLSQEGFEVVLRNTHLQGALGELPLTCRPEVLVVHDQDYEAGRVIVDAVEARRRALPGPDLVCPVCQETSPAGFELCWKCRAPIES